MGEIDLTPVDDLVRFSRKYIRDWTIPDHQPYAHLFFKIVVIEVDGNIEVPVEDEYFELSTANPAVIMHLVLTTMSDYNECISLEEWCKLLGLKTDGHMINELYDKIKTAKDLLPEGFFNCKPISPYDVEFNTGITRALRALSPNSFKS